MLKGFLLSPLYLSFTPTWNVQKWPSQSLPLVSFHQHFSCRWGSSAFILSLPRAVLYLKRLEALPEKSICPILKCTFFTKPLSFSSLFLKNWQQCAIGLHVIFTVVLVVGFVITLVSGQFIEWIVRIGSVELPVSKYPTEDTYCVRSMCSNLVAEMP